MEDAEKEPPEEEEKDVSKMTSIEFRHIKDWLERLYKNSDS